MLEIKFIESASDNQLLELLVVYQSAGWWDSTTEDYQLINKIISRSFCFVVATIEQKIIGMGRSISDGISDAYIQDIAVLPEYKGRGIGKLLVEKILSRLEDEQISWIGLIATPDADKFYQKIGFTVMPNFTPMLYKKQE